MSVQGFKKLSSVILLAIIASFAVGLPLDLLMVQKVAAKVRKPNVQQWINYCDKYHPDKSLRTCCSRRSGACETRCKTHEKKRRFKGSPYKNKAQCLQDCRMTTQACNLKAKSRKGQAPKSPRQKVLDHFAQCQRFRDVVKINGCCLSQGYKCDKACRGNKKCLNRCDQTMKTSCIKKHKTITKKPHRSQWMHEYCSQDKNTRGGTRIDCCLKMVARCLSSCQGYPDGEIQGCKDRCKESHRQCM